MTAAQGGGVRDTTPITPARLHDSPGVTIERLAEAKGLPPEAFTKIGAEDVTYLGAPAVAFNYPDADGQVVARRFRRAIGAKDGSRWRRGDKAIPYGLDRLDEAHERGHIVICEGETDLATLVHHGVPALGLPGATTWDESRDAPMVDGIETVYVVIETGEDGEPDNGGRNVLDWLSRSAIRHRAHLLTPPGGDVNEFHKLDPATFKRRFKEAKKSAIPWHVHAEREAMARAADALARCHGLERAARILDLVGERLVDLDLVEEQDNAKIVFLAIVSRLLDRPISVALKGPSGGGKNTIVKLALKLFPESACVVRSAMSERALAYGDESLVHRMLVVYEAVGLTGETGSYLIRSLLSEGHVRYETVEKTRNGLRSKLIDREGPTGFITTTTATNLHPENETRLLSLTVTDTREHTAKILKREGQAAEGHEHVDVDVDDFVALGEWLEHPPHDVIVPFASALAEKIPAVAVRQRRDFNTLISLIKAHALLHRATRDRDDHGRIVATIEDYAIVRELVKDVMGETISATVSDNVTETVRAVETLENGPDKCFSISVQAVAGVLDLDRSAASRRVQDAVDLGYLRDLRERESQPARLTTIGAEPLPEAVEVLPDPQTVHACTRDRGGSMHPPPPLNGHRDIPAEHAEAAVQGVSR